MHLGICGNIFDGKCTNLVPGRLFGQSGRLRICRPCEAIVYGTEDDSSVYSDDVHVPARYASSRSHGPEDGQRRLDSTETPSLGIPVAASKRGSAVIEFTSDHSLIR